MPYLRPLLPWLKHTPGCYGGGWDSNGCDCGLVQSMWDTEDRVDSKCIEYADVRDYG